MLYGSTLSVNCTDCIDSTHGSRIMSIHLCLPCLPCLSHPCFCNCQLQHADDLNVRPLTQPPSNQAGADFERIDVNRLRSGSDSRQRLGSGGGSPTAGPPASASMASMVAPREAAPKRSVNPGQKLLPAVAPRIPPLPPAAAAAADDDYDKESFMTVRTRAGGDGWGDGFDDAKDHYASAFDAAGPMVSGLPAGGDDHDDGDGSHDYTNVPEGTGTRTLQTSKPLHAVRPPPGAAAARLASPDYVNLAAIDLSGFGDGRPVADNVALPEVLAVLGRDLDTGYEIPVDLSEDEGDDDKNAYENDVIEPPERRQGGVDGNQPGGDGSSTADYVNQDMAEITSWFGKAASGPAPVSPSNKGALPMPPAEDGDEIEEYDAAEERRNERAAKAQLKQSSLPRRGTVVDPNVEGDRRRSTSVGAVPVFASQPVYANDVGDRPRAPTAGSVAGTSFAPGKKVGKKPWFNTIRKGPKGTKAEDLFAAVARCPSCSTKMSSDGSPMCSCAERQQQKQNGPRRRTMEGAQLQTRVRPRAKSKVPTRPGP